MNKRLFVGNLPYEFTEDDLRNLFSPYGEVQYVKIITDRDSGRSKGFGFVELTEEAADKAVAELNGKSIDGPQGPREVVVNIARPMEERPQNGGGGRDFNRGGDRGGRDRNFRGGNKSW